MTPTTGQIYLCLKTSGGAVKGKYYVYRNGELRTYTTRSVTVLANGDELLGRPRLFMEAQVCPFCGKPACGDAWIHDGNECAKAWDARVKHYCRRCGADTKNGKCEKCEPT